MVARSYFSPGGASQRGMIGRLRSVSHVVGPSQGSGLMGWVGSRWVPSGYVRVSMVPYRSGSVYQPYTDMRQSRDPSGLVGSCWDISGSDGFPSEPCFGTTGPGDRARRVARLSRIGAQSMYGPIRDPPAAPRALRGPVGTRRAPGGPPAAPSDPVLQAPPRFCLLYTSPSPRDRTRSRMPSSA